MLGLRPLLTKALSNRAEAFISFQMEAIEMQTRLSATDYLVGERRSEIRHEYIGGHIYAVARASEEHNVIAGNIFTALHASLRGRPCRVFMADMKVALDIAGEEIFYYPDVMVACDPLDRDRYAKRFPKVLIEVLSPETERTDRREKLFSYTQIESMEEYVLVAQERPEVEIFRRANQWRPEILQKAEDSLRLASLDFQMPLGAVYDGVSVNIGEH